MEQFIVTLILLPWQLLYILACDFLDLILTQVRSVP